MIQEFICIGWSHCSNWCLHTTFFCPGVCMHQKKWSPTMQDMLQELYLHLYTMHAVFPFPQMCMHQIKWFWPCKTCSSNWFAPLHHAACMLPFSSQRCVCTRKSGSDHARHAQGIDLHSLHHDASMLPFSSQKCVKSGSDHARHVAGIYLHPCTMLEAHCQLVLACCLFLSRNVCAPRKVMQDMLKGFIFHDQTQPA